MRKKNQEIYNLEGEDEATPKSSRAETEYSIEPSEDDSRLLYAEDELSAEENEDEDDEEKSGANPKSKKRKRSPLTLLFSMMVNPTEGWKRIRRSGFKSEEVASSCFYPLTALASASVFMDALYGTETEVTPLVISALIVFMSFFLGFFVTSLCTRLLLPDEMRNLSDTEYGKQYALYLLSTLTIFYTLGNCLPMLDPVLVFLPLWTVYLGCKGTRWMRIADNRKHTVTALLSAIVVLSPVALYRLFEELL